MPTANEKLDAVTEIVIALEKLNGGIARMALHDPLQANLMPTRSEEEIAQQLRDFDPEMKGILITAYAGRTYWEPTVKPWGLFLLPEDKTPEKGVPFGIVSFPYGMEKTREFTETTLNRLNANLKNPDVIKIIQVALATNAITDDTAIKLLAGTQLLDVVFREEHQLFLSPESLREWEATKQKISTP